MLNRDCYGARGETPRVADSSAAGAIAVKILVSYMALAINFVVRVPLLYLVPSPLCLPRPRNLSNTFNAITII